MEVSNIIGHLKNENFSVGEKNRRYSILAFWFFLIFTAGYLLKSPEKGSESVRAALVVCSNGLIPAIFPFIVLVNMISRSGLPNVLARWVGKPLSVIFGTDESSAYAFLLGIFGGFPIGAVCVGELYKNGSVDIREAERLCAAVNVASPAFCIGVVGGIFSDTSFGVRLYFCQLAAAFTVCLLGRKRRSVSIKAPTSQRGSITKIITEAIGNGGTAIIKICAYVIFFAVVGDGIYSVISRFFGQTAGALVAAFFEITLSTRKAVMLPLPLSMLISAFSVGYSGISVHMQTAAVIGCPISHKQYHARRLLQGVLCAIYVYIASFLQ